MRLLEGPVTLADSWGDAVGGRRRLVPVATARAGRRVAAGGTAA